MDSEIPDQKLPNVYRSEEAYRFLDSIKDPKARGALSCVHQALLECYGSNLELLAEPTTPVEPIDLLIFYQAVAETFVEWTDSLIQAPSSTMIEQKILNKKEALDHIASRQSEPARIGLRNFLTHLLSMDVSATGPGIDLLFCCRLLTPCLENPQILSGILDGSIAHYNEQLERDPRFWASAWFRQGS